MGKPVSGELGLEQMRFSCRVGAIVAVLLVGGQAAAQTTERVSVNSDEVEADRESGGADVFCYSCAPSISANGRFVAFESHALNLVPGYNTTGTDVFVRDRQAGVTERISGNGGLEGNRESRNPSMSADGRFVAFQSAATNFLPGDTNDSIVDIFVRDRLAGTTEKVSLNSNEATANRGSSFPSISADGRFVAFRSYASNLVTGDTNGKYRYLRS